MKLSNQSCLLLTRLCVLCYRPVLIEKLKCSRHHLHFQIHLDTGQVERLVMERWRRRGENIFEVLYLTGGKDGKGGGGKKEMM